MLHTEALGLLVGAVDPGTIHGIEPGHGWPVAASYALDQTNNWLYGFAASVILGHLVSNIAMVAVFFYAKDYFNPTRVNEPIELANGVVLGGSVSVVAGVLLVLLGIREYRHGHSHGGHGHEATRGHDHGEGDSHGDTASHESVPTEVGHHRHESSHDHGHRDHTRQRRR